MSTSSKTMTPSMCVPGRPSHDTMKQENRDRYLPILATEEGQLWRLVSWLLLWNLPTAEVMDSQATAANAV